MSIDSGKRRAREKPIMVVPAPVSLDSRGRADAVVMTTLPWAVMAVLLILVLLAIVGLLTTEHEYFPWK